MPRTLVVVALSTLVVAAAVPGALSARSAPSVAAHAAVSTDRETARAAIAELRSAGPAGLEAFLAVHGAGLPAIPAADDPRTAALDAVCAQRHCAASRLFWFTDLAAARAEARRSGRPILSLRLLGKLDEDESCANSRYFRTLLYADPEVARVLRSRFVLHWHSERPIPRVTIDYGDGRTSHRTLTGNSAHLVLDQDGNTVDVIPGLYAPAAFVAALESADRTARSVARLTADRRQVALRAYHSRLLDAARQPELVVRPVVPTLSVSPALAADKLAMTKSEGERPLLRQVGTRSRLVELQRANALAAQRRRDERKDGVLSPTAREFIAQEARLRGVDPSAMLSRLKSTLAADTQANETLRQRVHAWFVEGSASSDPDVLTPRVYAELFQAPLDDPSMGLLASDAFLALDATALRAR